MSYEVASNCGNSYLTYNLSFVKDMCASVDGDRRRNDCRNAQKEEFKSSWLT